MTPVDPAAASDLLLVSRSAEARDAFVQQVRAVQPGWRVLSHDGMDDTVVLGAEAALVLDCRGSMVFGQHVLRRQRDRPAGSGPAPFVLAIINNEETAKAWAVRAGVDDVLLAPFTLLDLHLRLLVVQAVRAQRAEAARLASRAREVEAESARLRALAYTDRLTGLPNRLYLEHWVTEALAARDGAQHFAFQMLDLDGFKQVNDRHGHHVGDVLLKQAGDRIVSVSRRRDLVVRLGGDEIAIVQLGAVTAEDCAALAGRLEAMFEAPFNIGALSIRIGISIGSALYPEDSSDFGDLMRRADAAMYAAKAAGGFDPRAR